MSSEEQQVLTEGYTASQAAEVMSKNSGRPVDPDLPKKLAQAGVIRRIKVSSRFSLYNKLDVDQYRVEARGTKAGRAARQRAKS